MKVFEIVAINPAKRTYNVLESGYESYQEASQAQEYWLNQYPNVWIAVLTSDERKAMVKTENLTVYKK